MKLPNLSSLKASVTFAGTMAFLSHFTTFVTFGTAILAVLFPQTASDYVARALREIDRANDTLEQVSNDTERTADAATVLADNVAQKPRFSAKIKQTGFENQVQFQLTWENLTARSVENIRIAYLTDTGALTTSRKIYTIPPFERLLEVSTQTVRAVCVNFELVQPDGSRMRFTEYREITANGGPTVDEMGNAGTFDVNVTLYTLEQDTLEDAFKCNTTAIADTDFRLGN